MKYPIQKLRDDIIENSIAHLSLDNQEEMKKHLNQLFIDKPLPTTADIDPDVVKALEEDIKELVTFSKGEGAIRINLFKAPIPMSMKILSNFCIKCEWHENMPVTNGKPNWIYNSYSQEPTENGHRTVNQSHCHQCKIDSLK